MQVDKFELEIVYNLFKIWQLINLFIFGMMLSSQEQIQGMWKNSQVQIFKVVKFTSKFVIIVLLLSITLNNIL